jgi:hypothetical protein
MYWKSKNGEQILIKEMTDQHLINCLNMLKKNYKNKLDNGYSALGTFSSDSMASYYAEGEVNSIHLPDSYYELLKEYTARGLK